LGEVGGNTPSPTFTPVPTATNTPCPGIIGDVDNDGDIDSADALLCFQIALGIYTPTADEACRADADGNGIVNSSDALCIFQQALGIPNNCFSRFGARAERSGAVKLPGALSLTIEPQGKGRYLCTVWLEKNSAELQDLQFDIVFDPRTVSYGEDRFSLGALIADWPLADDNILEPGHVRFAALDWNKGIAPGSSGELLRFEIEDICGGCTESSLGLVSLIRPDGGIAGFRIY